MSISEKEAREIAQHAESQRRNRAVLGGDFILDQPDTIPAVWGQGEKVLWAEGEGLMLVGHQGVGKTTIAQQVVLARLGLRNAEFLGLPVARSDRSVVYLAMDRPRQAARSFQRMVSESARDDLNRLLGVWKGPLPVDPLGAHSSLADWLDELWPGYSAVVVDSVKDLASDLSNGDTAAALNSAWQEIIARGKEVLLLHHERKSGGGDKRLHALDDVYGSTWLTSGLGSVVAIHGNPGDPTVELRHLKQPAEPVGPLTVRHDHSTGTSTLFDGSTDLMDILRANPDGLTAAEIAQHAYGRGTDSDRQKIRRALNALAKNHQASKQPGQHTGNGAAQDIWRPGFAS